MSSLAAPEETRAVRIGRYSALLPVRPSLAALGVGIALAAAVVTAVMVGNGRTTGWTALSALLGGEDAAARQIVHQLRLPRAVAGALAGAALGVSGCLIQTLARNRLATPDLVGVNDGAVVGVLLTVTGGTMASVGAWWAGPAGAMAAGALVVALAGGLATTGYRVLVVGLGLSIAVGALTDLTLARQGIDAARGLFTWTLGNLNGRDYGSAAPVAVGLAVLAPAVIVAGRRLRLLRLSDDTVASLGVSPGRARLGALACAMVLAGLAVGVGGPIAFVAMAAPIIAQRLAGVVSVPLVVSALTGATLVVLADTLGRAAGEVEIPAGVLTSILGGPFLLWVLLTRKA